MEKKNLIKKTIAFALAAVLTFGAVPLAGLCAIELPSLGLFTASAAVETDYLYTTIDNQITITGHNNPVGKLVIPEAINDLPVTKISSDAFGGCEMITAVSIPSSVSMIELNAFANCPSLTSVTFETRSNDQLLEIGNLAFSGCTSLSSINLEDSNVVNMGGGIFRDCSALTKIIMPDTLTNVEGGIFYRCTSLNDVTLSENMTALNNFGARLEGFFYGCTSLAEIEIPANITTIGYDAFRDSGIRKITFAEKNKLTTVSSLAFCNSKLQSVTIPATVTLIDSQAFQDCTSLSSVIFENRSEDQVLKIGSHAFSGCTSLSSINLEDSNIISMGGNVFRDCSALEKIVMPDTLINVDGGVFYRCTNLEDVTLSKNMTALNDFGARLEGFFYGCTSLAKIEIPANITTIGYDAFRDSGIQKITFEENSKLTTISSQAFCNSKLQSITIPATVTSIGRIAFQNTELAWIAFDGNKNLEIDNHVFDSCEKLTDVYYSGTEEEWNEITINESGNSYLLNAVIHFNSNGPKTSIILTNNSEKTNFESGEKISLSASVSNADEDTKIVWFVNGEKASEGENYTEGFSDGGIFEIKVAVVDGDGNIVKDNKGNEIAESITVTVNCKLDNDEYGVSASYDYGYYDEAVELSIKPVTKDREPGGIYIPNDMTLERVGCFDISIVKKGSDIPAEKKSDGTITIRMPIPEKFKGQKDFRIVHYLKKGGYDNLSTEASEERLKIAVDGDYLVFNVTEFSDFDIFTLVSAPTVSIKNNTGSKTISYGETLRLTANTSNMPADAKIFWYVDGVKSGEGTTFEASPESGSVEVTVRVVDADGNNYAGADISDSQKVSVKSGFFQKLISFFKNLFGISRIVTQAFKTM